MALSISSTAFENYGDIPARHTCDGEDVPPPLRWSGVPDGTKSLVLIVDDPDAPRGNWVHWVVVDLPPDSTGIDGTLPRGAREGHNDFGRIGYGGPCPPSGTHRYFFRLYALDTKLPALTVPTRAQVEQAMVGHVLAEAALIGRYQR
ncbi:MAG: YbhB/YbcL family Raf kinase inhibitor-like protein [Myxococcaceae bacterium]|nr:YbhB/YbcL family Raf kinase inhibitor-like protein [Myxococcaceae bacterium]